MRFDPYGFQPALALSTLDGLCSDSKRQPEPERPPSDAKFVLGRNGRFEDSATLVQERVDRREAAREYFCMSDIIYPRSPREVMAGWMHLPRYIDKIRLHLAGTLHEDYRENLGKGFDSAWLKAAGLTHEQFVEVVKGTVIDAQVADWVLKNVRKSEVEKNAHAEAMFNYPKPGDEAMQARLKMRKEQAGLSHRDDIKRFLDFIDADEKRI